MKFAVILSGCGVFDGAEIHESVLTLYALAKRGIEYEIFAPDIEQAHVIDHFTGQEIGEKRNVLSESARIARGKISTLSKLQMKDFDALIMPGGFGVAKNLCDFAFKSTEMSVIPELEKVILEAVAQRKPIGALCISPVVLAKVLKGAELTIGRDKSTSEAVEKLGGRHIQTSHGQVVVDKKYKLATTPCYMLDATIVEIGEGAFNVVDALLEMVEIE
jgi:enhancing lycopene biosynthesis protein 2